MSIQNHNTEFHTIHESLRASVWNAMYENDLVSRYYQELLKKHKRWYWISRLVTVTAALLMVCVSIAVPKIWVKVISAMPFLGFYFADTKIRFIKINLLTKIRSGSDVVGTMLNSLWREIETGALDEASVKYRLAQIEQTEFVLVSRHIEEAAFTEDRELNIKCAEESKEIMINFYNGARA